MENLIEKSNILDLEDCLPELEQLIKELRSQLNTQGGNTLKYNRAINTLPDIQPSIINLSADHVTAGIPDDIDAEQLRQLKEGLFHLCPWRKGPFRLFGMDIDAEWRSFLKWERFFNDISPLKNRKILDIGSSNGYYMFKMAAHAPLMVLGVEPQHTFYFQYLAMQKYLNLDNVFCLPVGFDGLPLMRGYFDTIFCMGVLYHRKSPLDMLKQIHDSMKTGGELVLENLVIESHEPFCLFPENRYAKMRNIFFIPSLKTLESWLFRTGFRDIQCLDISKTTHREQRKTPWIQTESLEDFLHPDNPSKTIEGYPAPVRAIFKACA